MFLPNFHEPLLLMAILYCSDIYYSVHLLVICLMNNMHFLQVCPSHWWLSHLAHYRYFKRNLKKIEVYNSILFVLRFMTPIVCYWIKETTLFSYFLLYFVNCEFGFSNTCLLFDVCILCHTKASHELCSGTRIQAVNESHLEAGGEEAKWAQWWNKNSWNERH